MRPGRLFLLAALMTSGCGSPLAALPLMAAQPKEQALAVPTEDGNQYVLVEVQPRTSNAATARRWRRTATDACMGDYLVLSQASAMRRSGGKMAMRIHEGWVRCVNPEAAEAPTKKAPEQPKVEEPAPAKFVPKAFAL